MLVATLTILALTLPSTSAGHCTTWSTSRPEVAAAGLYFDTDLCQPHCLLSAWVYQETNGIAGLQRADAQVDDTCHGLILADRALL